MPESLLWYITSCVSVFDAFIIRDLTLGTKMGKRSVPQRCYDRDRGGKQCIKIVPFTLPVLVLWHCSRWLMLSFQVSIPRHCWPRLVCFDDISVETRITTFSGYSHFLIWIILPPTPLNKQTLILIQMMRVNCDTAQEYYMQQTIKDKLQGYSYAYPKSTATILISMAQELKQLRDNMAACVAGAWT